MGGKQRVCYFYDGVHLRCALRHSCGAPRRCCTHKSVQVRLKISPQLHAGSIG